MLGVDQSTISRGSRRALSQEAVLADPIARAAVEELQAAVVAFLQSKLVPASARLCSLTQPADERKHLAMKF